MSTTGLTDVTETALYNGDSAIKVQGYGSEFILFVDNEEVGEFDTYTDALNHAIYIVNEVG